MVRATVKPTDTVKDLAYKGALVHAAVATVAGFASKRLSSGKASDFMVGGMWGSGVGAASLAALPSLSPDYAKEPALPRPAVSGLKDGENLKKVVRLLTGASGG